MPYTGDSVLVTAARDGQVGDRQMEGGREEEDEEGGRKGGRKEGRREGGREGRKGRRRKRKRESPLVRFLTYMI